MGGKLAFFIDTARAFLRSRRGNVAMIFALSFVPVCIAAGVGLDFARGMMVRSAMSEALDAAALAVGSTPGLTHDTAQALAQKYFNANYTGDASYGTPTVTIPTSGYNTNPGSVTITATDSMPTTLLRVAGFNAVPLNTSSTVVWGQSKLWVSLVLDNTGSMCEPDSSPCDNDTNSGIKINALKSATNQLLDTLHAAATNDGDVKVSIVPFDQDTNWGTSMVGSSWISWTDWESEPANANLNGVTDLQGPGDSCPFTTSSNRTMSPYGFYCGANATNGASNVSSIPSSGLICPTEDPGTYNSGRMGRYYNGCYTSVATGSTKQVSSGSFATCSGYANCTCSGSNSNKKCNANYYKHTWTVNAHSTWSGCIMDRDQDADTYDSSTNSNGYPAVNSTSSYTCPSAKVVALSYDWTTLSSKVNSMIASGGTNQTVGLANGMETLSPSGPYPAGVLPSNTTRYIILLSDGLNTIDRWYGNGSSQSSQVDDRMALACQHAKDEQIVIYTIFVDLGSSGNSTILQNCASDSTKYFHLTTSGSIITTFNQIAQQITNVRVSR